MQFSEVDILEQCIYPAVREMALSHERDVDSALKPDVPFMGAYAIFDSYEFVSLMILIEKNIPKVVGKKIRLLSEKAFSHKLSPFKDAQSLAQYIAITAGENE